jgi:glutamate transport system substrate-binding protein
MKQRMMALIALSTALATPLTACGGGGEATAPVAVNTTASFPAGTTMAQLHDAGKVRIGVKFDQPGLGFRKPGTDRPTGFDIEIAEIVTAELGIQPENIEWVETVTKNREAFIQNDSVDLVVATYAITDERRKVIGQAGPYYVTGQQLLVRSDDTTITSPEHLGGKKVCSVTGSTSIKRVQEKYGATPAPFATYSECVTQLLNGSVDAVTTDGAILLGYAAEEPTKLKVVGQPFSQERYGIGFKKGDQPMCDFLKRVINESFTNGSWKTSFTDTLGTTGAAAPAPPAVDAECWQ